VRVALSSALEAVAAELPTALVDENAQRKLSRIAARVPSVWDSFGFECRLGGVDRAVDLGVSVTPHGGGRDALSGFGTDSVLAEALARNEGWRRLRDFAERWRMPESLLYRWSPFLFLEFDADSVDQPIPVPSVFVAIDAPLVDDAGKPHRAAACEAAELLLGTRLAHALQSKLEECFDALPPEGYVLHVGAMLGRSASGVRLSVLLPGKAVPSYLSSLGGFEAAQGARVGLGSMPSWLTSAQVDFDLSPRLCPRIGFGVRPSAVRGESWEVLLGDLVALGCCEPAKARALLAWPGARTIRSGTGWAVALRRELSHVKLVCAPGSEPEAKAYFTAGAVAVMEGSAGSPHTGTRARAAH